VTHELLEKALCDFLEVDYISLFSSGTLALILALKSQNLTGEVITTPFTHISTIQALHWNNLKPVFVDIDKTSLNLDPYELEKAISAETTAILPVHVFGNPCNITAIERLAGKYHLKVIYDAAHCFGVKINGQSILKYGDLSVLSFHATKVFNTIEGGAVISHNRETKELLDALSNCGMDRHSCITGYGINSKMNEIQAAFGLATLKLVPDACAKRQRSDTLYRELLKNIKGISVIEIPDTVMHNYIYFPVIIDPAIYGYTVEEVREFLSIHNIFAKRYFYPLVCENDLFKSFRKSDLSVAHHVSDNILCLPLSHKLTAEEIQKVVNLLAALKDSGVK
jgi:dTDP-4-amino-4,6-dideoxygalactose transaminase